jgi:hypothetical protein
MQTIGSLPNQISMCGSGYEIHGKFHLWSYGNETVLRMNMAENWDYHTKYNGSLRCRIVNIYAKQGKVYL